jgi:hypothetical protein
VGWHAARKFRMLWHHQNLWKFPRYPICKQSKLGEYTNGLVNPRHHSGTQRNSQDDESEQHGQCQTGAANEFASFCFYVSPSVFVKIGHRKKACWMYKKWPNLGLHGSPLWPTMSQAHLPNEFHTFGYQDVWKPCKKEMAPPWACLRIGYPNI